MISSLPHPQIDYAALQKRLLLAKNDKELFRLIVNVPFTYKVETTLLFLGMIVFLLVNKKTGVIDRVAISDTELAKNAIQVSVLSFEKTKIPIDYSENIITQAIQTGKTRETNDWKFVLAPALTAEQARINQASAGIAYSAVYPLKARDGGALIFSYFQYPQEIGFEQHDFMQNYSEIVNNVLRLRSYV